MEKKLKNGDGIDTDATWKSYDHNYLLVTGFKCCYSSGVCFVEVLTIIFGIRGKILHNKIFGGAE